MPRYLRRRNGKSASSIKKQRPLRVEAIDYDGAPPSLRRRQVDKVDSLSTPCGVRFPSPPIPPPCYTFSQHFAAFRKGGRTVNTEHTSTNGKTPAPVETLPSVIEDKPIVYEPGQLKEIREVASLPPIHLKPDEIEYAISLFSRGFARGEVVVGLIEQYPDYKHLCETDETFRKRLSDRLRTCDPTSAIFAESRYKTLYDLHREHVERTLGTAYSQIEAKLKETLLARVEEQAARLETIDLRIAHLHELFVHFDSTFRKAKMKTSQDEAFERFNILNQSILKWYNLRMKEEQHLETLFISLKTLEVKLSKVSSLHATYTPQEW